VISLLDGGGVIVISLFDGGGGNSDITFGTTPENFIF